MIRLLIVDDDIDIRLALKSLAPSNFKVIEASNVNQAIDLLRSNLIDIILCDLCLESKASGLDLVVRLRELNINRPFVLLTGLVTQEVIAQSKKLGVLEIIEKPISPEDIFDKLEKIIFEKI